MEFRAELFMGINLSFCPFPIHLITDSEIFISEIFKFTNSEILVPQPYNISIIAVSRFIFLSFLLLRY